MFLPEPRSPKNNRKNNRVARRLFLRLFFVLSAQGAPREGGLCGLRHSSAHHREVGVSRSDLRGAQGQVAHTWPLRLRLLGPEVCALKWWLIIQINFDYYIAAT